MRQLANANEAMFRSCINSFQKFPGHIIPAPSIIKAFTALVCASCLFSYAGAWKTVIIYGQVNLWLALFFTVIAVAMLNFGDPGIVFFNAAMHVYHTHYLGADDRRAALTAKDVNGFVQQVIREVPRLGIELVEESTNKDHTDNTTVVIEGRLPHFTAPQKVAALAGFPQALFPQQPAQIAGPINGPLERSGTEIPPTQFQTRDDPEDASGKETIKFFKPRENDKRAQDLLGALDTIQRLKNSDAAVVDTSFEQWCSKSVGSSN